MRELEGGAGGEGDVAIGGEQSDQGDHDAGDGLDRSLAVETEAAAEGAQYCPEVWRRFSGGIELHNQPGAATLRIVHLYDSRRGRPAGGRAGEAAPSGVGRKRSEITPHMV